MLIPAVLALTLSSFLTARRQRVERDLHLLAPQAITPGEALPLRAHLFGDLDRAEGPRLLDEAVTVELVDPAGAVRASTRLSPGHAGSQEGSLQVPVDGPVDEPGPGDAQHPWRLKAHTDEAEVRGGSCERRLRVGPPGREATTPEPRALRALGSFAPGPLRTEPGGAGAARLELVIGGGACVPEQACELLVYTAATDLAVAVEAGPAVTPVGQAQSTPGAPVASLWVTVHGPEAELTLVALRGTERIAWRSFRLPVALGSDALAAMPSLPHAPALPTLRMGGEPGGCIVDAYHEGRWQRSASLPDCGAGDPVPFAALTPGLWRLQVRRDPFGSASAAVRALYVRAAGEAGAEVLESLAAQVDEHAQDDPLLARVRSDARPYVEHLEIVARYLLARTETGLYALPRSTSGHEAALALLAAELGRMHDLALWALALCGVLLVLLVLRRGLLGTGAAARVLEAAGTGAEEARRLRLRALLTVAATAASLALAFVAIAIYVIARSMGP